MTTHAGDDPECQLAGALLPAAASAAAAGDPQQPASAMPPAIPTTTVTVVVSCVQTGSADLLLEGSGSSAKEIACSTSTASEVAFPVLPTVSVESDEPQNLSLTWYAPTCASDFTLEWVQFVMKQYLNNSENNQDNFYSPKQAENIQQFQVNMAGSPEDEATKKG